MSLLFWNDGTEARSAYIALPSHTEQVTLLRFEPKHFGYRTTLLNTMPYFFFSFSFFPKMFLLKWRPIGYTFRRNS